MKGLLCKAKSGLKRSSPTILTCLSIVGLVGTTVLAVKLQQYWKMRDISVRTKQIRIASITRI